MFKMKQNNEKFAERLNRHEKKKREEEPRNRRGTATFTRKAFKRLAAKILKEAGANVDMTQKDNIAIQFEQRTVPETNVYVKIIYPIAEVSEDAEI